MSKENKTPNNPEEKKINNSNQQEKQITTENEHQNNKKKTRKKLFISVIIIIVIILLILFYLKSCNGNVNLNNNSTSGNKFFDLILDNNAQEGKLEGKSKEEIEAELNQKVNEGMINISMNLNPEFEEGKSYGNLLIMNEEINNYPQIVEIIRNDTQKVIYRSGLIPVGSRVDTGKLMTDLPAGEYDCTACFYNVNPDTGEALGKACAQILVTILN